MKKIISFVVLMITGFTLCAQSPQAFQYQAIARDNAGNTLANQNVSCRISLLQGNTSGDAVYVETHNIVTNQFGLLNLDIGNGEPELGPLSETDWANGPYFLQLEMDAAGGSNYQLMGTSQLLSVPYALHSASTGDTTRWRRNADDLYYLDGKVGIGTTTPSYNLDINSSSSDLGSSIRIANSDISKYLRLSSGSETFNPSIYFSGGDALRFMRYDNGYSELMRITGDGNVGIGTTEPWVKLDIRGNSPDEDAVIRIGNSDGSHWLTFFPGRENDPNPFIQWKEGDPLRFSTDEGGWSEKMRMTSDGKLAIGTTDPLGNLDIHGNDSARIYITPADTANSLTSAIMFRSTFGGTIPDFGPRNTALIKAHFDGGGWETAALAFHVSGSDCMIDSEADPCERLRITNEGLVGVGTTTPGYRLDVRGNYTEDGSAISLGNSDLSHQLVLYGGRESDPNPFILWKDGDPLRFSTDEGGWSEKMRIASNGYVGIGTSNPYTGLHIKGSGWPAAFLSLQSSDDNDAGIRLYEGETAKWHILNEGVNDALVIRNQEFTGVVFYADQEEANVGIGTDDPEESALLDLSSTSKGFLPPKLNSAQRDAIPSPVEGLMIYNTEKNMIEFYDGERWRQICYPSSAEIECGEELLDSRDQQLYRTVKIGTQCWMAENLNIGTKIDGSLDQTDNGTIEKYCFWDSEANCTTGGGFYQWDEMMQYAINEGVKGICPYGWHVPTDAEFCILTQYIDETVNCDDYFWSGTDVGLKMKSASVWNGTDEFGFNAVQSGARSTNGGFYPGYTHFRSSTEFTPGSSWDRGFFEDRDDMERLNYSKLYGYSVRCIKD